MYFKPYSPQSQYTVLEAAALWHEQDPKKYIVPLPGAIDDSVDDVVVARVDGRNLIDQDQLVNDTFIKLRDTIKRGELSADLAQKQLGATATDIRLVRDWNRTTVLRQDLIEYAAREGVHPPFLFPGIKPHSGDAKKERLKALEGFVKSIYEAGRSNKESWAIENDALPFVVEDFWYVFQKRHPHIPPIKASSFKRDYRAPLNIRFNPHARSGRSQALEELLDSK